jgi:hypothetical protein
LSWSLNFSCISDFAQRHESGSIRLPLSTVRYAPVTKDAWFEARKLSENPDIGAYRMSAALEQMGIKPGYG